jgi:hypothetical protein
MISRGDDDLLSSINAPVKMALKSDLSGGNIGGLGKLCPGGSSWATMDVKKTISDEDTFRAINWKLLLLWITVESELHIFA